MINSFVNLKFTSIWTAIACSYAKVLKVNFDGSKIYDCFLRVIIVITEVITVFCVALVNTELYFGTFHSDIVIKEVCCL